MTSPHDAPGADEPVRAADDASQFQAPAEEATARVADETSPDAHSIQSAASFEPAETAPLDEPQSPDNGQVSDASPAEDVASFDDDQYPVDPVNDEPLREQSADVVVTDELTTLDRTHNLDSEDGTSFVAGPDEEPADELVDENESEVVGDDEEFADEAEEYADESYDSDDEYSEAGDEEYSEEYAEAEESDDESDDAPSDKPAQRGERLQKILAAAGVDSRRQCEELITAGRVEVNGEVVTTLGARAIPGEDEIRVDGVTIKVASKIYYAVNKPTNVLCTTHDPSGRTRVVDLLPNTQQRLFTVGRLDKDSEGLIIVTNDGELAQRLMHPKFGVEKTYKVQIAGIPEREVLQGLLDGVRLAEGVARAQSVKLLSTQRNSAWLEIVLTEGRNREIRRILAKVGHKVMHLQRIAVGPIRLKLMAPGEFRRLTQEEVSDLWKSSSEKRKRRPPMKTVQGKFRTPSKRFGDESEQGAEFETHGFEGERRPRRDRGEQRAAGFEPAEGRSRPRKPDADGGFVAPGKRLGFMRPSEDDESGERESTLMKFARRKPRPVDQDAPRESADFESGESSEGGDEENSRRAWKFRPGGNFRKKRFGDEQTGEYNSQQDAAERARREREREERRAARELGEGGPYAKRPFGARGGEGRPPFKKKSFDSTGPDSERAPYKKPFGARKPWGGRPSDGAGEERPHFKKRSFGERSEGDAAPFFKKRPYASRVEDGGEGQGEGARRPYGNKKPFGARKPYGQQGGAGRQGGYGQQGGYGRQGDKPFFKKRREEGEGSGEAGGEGRSPYAKKPFGQRKPWQGGEGGDRPFFKKRREEGDASGEGRPFFKKRREDGESSGAGEGRPFFKKRREEGGASGEGRPFFKKRPFGSSAEGGGFGGGEGRPPFRKKPFGARKPYGESGGESRPYFKKRRDDGEGFSSAGGEGFAPRGEGFGGEGGERRPFKKSFGDGPRKFGKPGGGKFKKPGGGKPFKSFKGKRKFDG